MKISYFNYIADVDGLSVGAMNKSKSFTEGLEALGHEVTINWLERQMAPSLSGVLRDDARVWLKDRLRRFAYEPKMLLKNIPFLFKEIRLLNEQAPDVVLERLNQFYLAGSALAKARRLPLVVECDGPGMFEYKTHNGKENVHIPFLPQFAEHYTLKTADACFVISQQLKDYFVKQGIDARKLHVIPNGADPEKFFPKPRDKKISEQYGIQGKTVVGWVGSLFGWSGVEKIVTMAKEMVANRDDVCFMFLCGGQNKRYFESYFPEQTYGGRVILPGMIPFEKVNDYLSCMDVVLAPYPHQDFWYASSMKIFEYMAAGKAVVASGIG